MEKVSHLAVQFPGVSGRHSQATYHHVTQAPRLTSRSLRVPVHQLGILAYTLGHGWEDCKKGGGSMDRGLATAINPHCKLTPPSMPGPAPFITLGRPRAPPHLMEEVALRRVTRAQRAEGPIYWNFKDSRMRGRHPFPLKYSILSALRTQHRDETLTPQVPQRTALHSRVRVGTGRGYFMPGRELGLEGRRAPSLLGLIPLP